MWVEALITGIAVAVAAAAVGTLIGTRQTLASVRADRDAERERSADLLSRLVARTHAEYAAFATPPEPPKTYADGEVIFDATGLVEVQLEREDDRVG